jgi:hypothetical protein
LHLNKNNLIFAFVMKTNVNRNWWWANAIA